MSPRSSRSTWRRLATGPTAKPENQGITPIRDIQRQLEDEAARADRVNTVRVADIRLQRADPEYATRAGSNNAHFLLARPETRLHSRRIP